MTFTAKRRRETATEQAAAYQRYFGEPPSRALFAADVFSRVTGIHDSLASIHHDAVSMQDDMVALHYYLRWGYLGCPTFQLTHALASALLLTDCRRVCGADIRMPFPSFEVILPDGLLEYDGSSSVLPASHLMYHEYGVAPRQISLTPQEIVERVATGVLDPSYLEAQPATYVSLCSLQSSVCLHRSILALAPEESVERFLFDQTTGTSRTRISPTLHYSPLDTAAIQGGLRLLVNLSLYLRDLQTRQLWSPRPSTSPGPGHGRTSRRTRAAPLPLFWTLGQEIKLDRALLQAARVRVGGERAHWRVQSRFAVRGHWRRVACGRGGAERRLVFVPPYWRGPEDGPQLLRQYTSSTTLSTPA